MDSRKFIRKETLVILLGEAICSAAMVGIFALLGTFDLSVLFGAVVGTVMSTLNFFFMAVGATLAADKAENQDVKGGTALIRSSYSLRLVVLFLVLIAFAKSGLCNVIAMVIPLAFVRPIITIAEFFRKQGDYNP